jgi:urease accessory protein
MLAWPKRAIARSGFFNDVDACCQGWCALKSEGWKGRLSLRYGLQQGRTVAHDAHDGPLRVLKALYPEGERICHHVLVHPPGGIVGGDELHIDVQVQAGAQVLITTPGATRFYRSAGAAASQTVCLQVAENARMEWLPLETIAYPGCRAANRVQFELGPGAQCLGWDVLALGLPESEQVFSSGEITQELHWPGVWLERGRIAANDHRLLTSPLGLDSQHALLMMWFASQAGWRPDEREALLEAARNGSGLARWGATAPTPHIAVLRALAPRVEPLLAAATEVRAAWRKLAWNMDAAAPRVWRT